MKRKYYVIAGSLHAGDGDGELTKWSDEDNCWIGSEMTLPRELSEEQAIVFAPRAFGDNKPT